MKFSAEFPNLMRFCLLQGYINYKVGVFLQPGKSHALDGNSDSTPRTLTLPRIIMAMEIGMVEIWNKDGFLIQAFIKLTFQLSTKSAYILIFIFFYYFNVKSITK